MRGVEGGKDKGGVSRMREKVRGVYKGVGEECEDCLGGVGVNICGRKEEL